MRIYFMNQSLFQEKLLTLCVCDVRYGFPNNWKESFQRVLEVQKLYNSKDSHVDIVGLVAYPDFELLSKKHLSHSYLDRLFNKESTSPSEILKTFIEMNHVPHAKIKEIVYFSALNWIDSGMMNFNPIPITLVNMQNSTEFERWNVEDLISYEVSHWNFMNLKDWVYVMNVKS
jgi:hypothetical protein